MSHHGRNTRRTNYHLHRGRAARSGRMAIACLIAFACGALWSQPAAAQPACGVIERASLDGSGAQANNTSTNPAMSADGRYVAFESAASNLVPGDTNNLFDIFVHDRLTGATERVSVSSTGEQGNSTSSRPALSAGGRYVAFQSYASNLVAGDTNGAQDIFVHDRQTGVTERVSVDSAGAQADGGSGTTFGAVGISGDGRYVAFESGATNLVAGDTNARRDVFVHDRETGATGRVSVDSAGVQGNNHSEFPKISGNGRFVVFLSYATNLVANDTNNWEDIFVHDRDTGATERVSVSSTGVEGNWASRDHDINGDGTIVTFKSEATTLVPEAPNGHQIYVRDRTAGTTTLVSRGTGGGGGNGASTQPRVSEDGRYVAFFSSASNLVSGVSGGQVYVSDWRAGTIAVASKSAAGTLGTGSSQFPELSGTGQYVVFHSIAANLLAGDTNGLTDTFVSENCLWTPPATTGAIAWVTPPPASATGGDAIPVEWELSGFTGTITQNRAHFGITSVLGSSPVQPGTNGVHGHTFTAPNVGAATTFGFVARALENGGQVLSPAASTTVIPGPTPPTVTWVTPPPASAQGGETFMVEWTVANVDGPLTQNHVVWGVHSVLGESANQPGANGTYSAMLTAPNVGEAKSISYAAVASDGIVTVVSPIVGVNVTPGAAPPTVTWVTPPPAAVESGTQFTVEWEVANFVDPAEKNAVGWGVTSLLGQSPDQPGGNGVYSATVTAPVVAAPGTIYYTAFAQNAIEFAFTPPVAVDITLTGPPSSLDVFPLASGTSWTYLENGTVPDTVTVQPGTVDVNGAATKLFLHSLLSTEEYYTNGAAGLFFHRIFLGSEGFTNVFSPAIKITNGTLTPGETVNSNGTAQVLVGGTPVATLPYSASATVIGWENVTVPAGTFLAMRVDATLTVSTTVRTITLWLAPGLGRVKYTFDTDTYVLTGSSLLP